MKGRISKWRSRLALRIPKALASEIGLHAGSEVELSVAGGALVVAPVERAALTLEDLLAGVSDANRHRERDSGPAVGAASW